jgi:hypothetical protein
MPRILALLALPLVTVLGACSAGSTVSSAVSSRVSSATSSARQAAEQKATDLAVRAFRSQVCSLSADGTLSSSDVSRLRQGLDAAAAAGVPGEVVDAVRPLVDRGRSATKAQVQQMRRQVCAG